MKKGIQILLFLSLIVVFTSCHTTETDKISYNKQYVKEIKEARKKMFYYVTINYVPGAAIAVSKNGKIIYSEAMGLASKDLNVDATRKTKFRIGELSELYTSLIYMKMVDNGLLNPDSTIWHYLPDFPQKKYKITLKDLAYNCSGIREERLSEEENWKSNISIQSGLNKFKNDSLLSPPRLYQSRSMFNYNLLGAIMEKVTKERFTKIIKNYLTDTLKLTNTTTDDPYRTINGRTNFFENNIVENITPATHRDLRFCAPSRGILSNAEDLVKLGNAIISSDFLSEKAKQEMFKPIPLYNKTPSKQTHGWFLIKTKSGDTIYGRASKVTGGGASILMYPKEKLIIATVTNLGVDLDETPVFDIADIFLQK